MPVMSVLQRSSAVLVAAAVLVTSALMTEDAVPEATASRTHADVLTATPRLIARGQPLGGRTVVIDAGHQLGNHNFPEKVNALVPAGGFKKACNTTGTATNGGFPEATFAIRVARILQARLERAGARVIMTRSTNRQDRWGPCVNVRGRAGNKADADLKISIHGDGNVGGGPGFHVIAPTDRKPWTHDVFKPSRRLATTVRRMMKRAGLPVASYVAGGDGLDFRSDLGTLNLSDVPVVLVECGNMRAVKDARRMTRRKGRVVYAQALNRAVRRYLG